MSNRRTATLSKNSEAYTYLRLEGFFVPRSKKAGQNLFSCDELTITKSSDIITKDDNQGPTAEQAASKVVKTTVEGNVTFGNLGELALRAAFGSADSDGNFVQEAVNDGVYTVETAIQKKRAVFQILHPVSGLPVQNVTLVSATWGTDGVNPVEAEEGVDFSLDRRTGVIEQLVVKPSDQTVAGNLVITYDAAAIAAEAENMLIGIGSDPAGKRGSLHLLGVNEDELQVRIDLWDVLITPDGAINVQATSEFSSAKAKIAVQSAQSFNGKPIPKNLRFGQVQKLSNAVLA